jgi:hypothetical protein
MAEEVDSQKLIDSDRKAFLLKMYDQMFSDIDRHIMVVWQSIGVLFGAVALFALVEKQVISMDIACTIFIIIAGWSIAHSLEAGYWYNRNLAIIANIERQFLRQSDQREIQYYFGKHRPHKLLKQLFFQVVMAVSVSIVFLWYHFSVRVQPGLGQPFSNFQISRALPYLFAVVIGCLLVREWKRKGKKYQEFLENSPGLDVDTSGIKYGIGHGGAGPTFIAPKTKGSS